jgi:hypothetical protein
MIVETITWLREQTAEVDVIWRRRKHRLVRVKQGGASDVLVRAYEGVRGQW